MIIEAHDSFGERLAGITVISSVARDGFTDTLGRTALYFSQSGLHVITLQSSNTATKQIKIKIPSDANKVVVVILDPK